MAGMRRGLRQTAYRLYQFFPPQLTGLRDGPSLNKFGQQRGARDGGHATLREKSYLLDAAVTDAQREFQYVAASGVLDLCGGVRLSHFAGVARMLEVIEDLV